MNNEQHILRVNGFVTDVPQFCLEVPLEYRPTRKSKQNAAVGFWDVLCKYQYTLASGYTMNYDQECCSCFHTCIINVAHQSHAG